MTTTTMTISTTTTTAAANMMMSPKQAVYRAVPLIDPILRLVIATIDVVHYLVYHSWFARMIQYGYHRFWIGGSVAQYVAILESLPKTPTHLAIGINHHQHGSLKIVEAKFRQVIEWCSMVPGLKTVTFFCPFMAENDVDRLQRVLQQEENQTKSEPVVNKPQVAILSITAGRQALIETARYFVANQTDTEVTPELISTHLRNFHYPHPDPQLALFAGEAPILNGFPCWQLRLTEIIFLLPIQWWTMHSFVQAIRRYASCKQRLGK